MSYDWEIAASFNEIWQKLQTQWTGEAADAYYRRYVPKMAEVLENFESACSGLSTGADDLLKKLRLFEQHIDSNS